MPEEVWFSTTGGVGVNLGCRLRRNFVALMEISPSFLGKARFWCQDPTKNQLSQLKLLILFCTILARAAFRKIPASYRNKSFSKRNDSCISFIVLISGQSVSGHIHPYLRSSDQEID